MRRVWCTADATCQITSRSITDRPAYKLAGRHDARTRERMAPAAIVLANSCGVQIALAPDAHLALGVIIDTGLQTGWLCAAS